MAILTKGTQVFALVPPVSGDGPNTVMQVTCAKAFNPGGSPAEQVEITCLDSSEREYMKGLRTPGQATLTIDADPNDSSHLRLYQLSQAEGDTTIKWALGWGDGATPPTLSVEGDDFELPEDRTWFIFEGYVADFPFNFELGAVVSTEISIQRSGASAWIPKSV